MQIFGYFFYFFLHISFYFVILQPIYCYITLKYRYYEKDFFYGSRSLHGCLGNDKL